MLPWINPTLIGVPLVSVLARSRIPPQIETATISSRVEAIASVRRRPLEIAASAKPVLSSATNTDRPYTPATLASCAIGSSVTIVLPSGIHGKPPIRMPRRYSVVSHTAGASHKPSDAESAHQDRRDRAEHRHVRGHVEREQSRHQHRHERRNAAEGRDGGAGPIHRAGVVDEAGDQAEDEAAPRRHAGQRAAAADQPLSATSSGTSAMNATAG